MVFGRSLVYNNKANMEIVFYFHTNYSFSMIYFVLKPPTYTDAEYRKQELCSILTQTFKIYFCRAAQHYTDFSKKIFLNA